MNVNELIELAIQASIDGGKEILEVYESDFAVETKDDRSPLTLADKNAHLAIMKVLESTGLPILSEEGREMPYSERSSWDAFWMVDPLDGTKEFIKRNGEFTVNIALIKNGVPIAGVIYVPVKKDLYFKNDKGSYKATDIQVDYSLGMEHLADGAKKLPLSESDRAFRVVGSRSHMSVETEEFVAKLKDQHDDIEIVSMGSSLKICLVAEGSADVYPRFAPTMEWDTAAGHAIVLGAGKTVTDYTTGQAMRYNKENLLNNWFVVR